MFTLAAIALTVIVGGIASIVGLLMLGFFFKFVVKLVLLPLFLALLLVKFTLVLSAIIVTGALLIPLAIVGFVLALPLLLIGAVVTAAVA
jgi:hypothetical protein